MSVSGHFVVAEAGRLFVTAWQKQERSRVAVICAPPGVEELNISRRQIAVQARQFCEQGMDTFVMDYFGTGDSEGQDFEATFQCWQQNLLSVINWVSGQGYEAIVLWGVRVGTLVITELLSRNPLAPVTALLFWQPLQSGAHWVSTLQRLQLLAGKQESANPYSEVAGYQLSEQLLQPINDFEWNHCSGVFEHYPCDIFWVSPQAEITDRLQEVFSFADSLVGVEGKPFWSIPELPINEPLITASTVHLSARVTLEADAHE